MNAKCLNCDHDFVVKENEINRRNKSKYRGRFCCRTCSSIFWGKIKKEKIKVNNVTCSYCNKDFYVKKCRITSSKNNIFFCCREHKDLAQSLRFGLTKIHPPHYGISDGQYRYREEAFCGENKECKCGLKYKGLLHVHHKDADRKNNNPDNLEIVCPTCHVIRHMFYKNGLWIHSYRFLTPRENLEEIEKMIYGGVAQLVERKLCKLEAQGSAGSTPATSTSLS